MTTQQFFKGAAMLLVSLVVTFFSQTPIDFALMGVTAVCTIITYTGKNLLPWFTTLHSDSPAGTLSLINLISALLIAIGTALTESIGLYLVAGAIQWGIVLKVVLSSVFTYLGTTFFAPPYDPSSKRIFIANPKKLAA